MGFLNNNRNQAMSQEQIWASRYTTARINILLVAAFTALNIVLLITESNIYFLFSAFVPYFLADLGMFLCGKYPAEYYAAYFEGMEFYDGTLLFVTLAIAAICVVLYVLSWALSKKRFGWMIFALVFFIIDTMAMFTLNGFSFDSLIDVVFHIWVIVSLFMGIVSYNNLKRLPETFETVVLEPEVAQPVEASDIASAVEAGEEAVEETVAETAASTETAEPETADVLNEETEKE